MSQVVSVPFSKLLELCCGKLHGTRQQLFAAGLGGVSEDRWPTWPTHRGKPFFRPPDLAGVGGFGFQQKFGDALRAAEGHQFAQRTMAIANLKWISTNNAQIVFWNGGDSDFGVSMILGTLAICAVPVVSVNFKSSRAFSWESKAILQYQD